MSSEMFGGLLPLGLIGLSSAKAEGRPKTEPTKFSDIVPPLKTYRFNPADFCPTSPTFVFVKGGQIFPCRGGSSVNGE